MSKYLRRLQGELSVPVVVEHRCYALFPTAQDLRLRFGSFAAAKRELLIMWREIAQLSECAHICPDRMEQRTFRFPYSLPALCSCKAAEWQRGADGHWMMFDLLQEALLVKAENIASYRVLRRYARQVGLDLARWECDMQSTELASAVQQDQQYAHQLGIFGVPALLINNTFLIQGDLPYSVLKAEILALVD